MIWALQRLQVLCLATWKKSKGPTEFKKKKKKGPVNIRQLYLQARLPHLLTVNLAPPSLEKWKNHKIPSFPCKAGNIVKVSSQPVGGCMSKVAKLFCSKDSKEKLTKSEVWGGDEAQSSQIKLTWRLAKECLETDK